MNDKQLNALLIRETDVIGAIRRCGNDEKLYISCLEAFLNDSTMEQINKSIKDECWDEAFTAVHALKGLAGNLGFIPLMHSTGRLVVLIRGGRLKEIGDSLMSVNGCYRDITDAIKQLISYEKE